MPWTSPLLLLVALGLVLPGTQASPFDPHLPSFSPSWFEGWYLRITTDLEHSDKGAPRSLGVVFGAHPHGLRAWNSSTMMLILQKDRHKIKPLRVVEGLNPDFNVSYRGHTIEGDPAEDTPPDFEVISENSKGVLRVVFDHEDCSIVICVGHYEVKIKCIGDPKPYGPDMESPEAWFSKWPTGIVGLHWFVHSMGNRVQYRVRHRGDTVCGEGWLHAEKNWGQNFPEGWIRAQGIGGTPGDKQRDKEESTTSSRTGTSSIGNCTAVDRKHRDDDDKDKHRSAFVVAGGVPPSPLLPPKIGAEIWLASIHVGDLQWRLHPWDPTVYQVFSYPCGDPSDPDPYATFHLIATQPFSGRGVDLFIKAPVESFSELNCPTNEGFKPRSDHSYSATAKLELFKLLPCQGFGCKKEKKVIHSEVMDDVALEFGGHRRCWCRQGVGNNNLNCKATATA